jgi:malic enzyme
METVTLPYIIPDIRLATGYKAGIRPYREGGVRMEKTKEENGKTVYHDYGHGGAGVSIAYGCAKHVLEKLFLEDKVEKEREIAVLGAGIVGLTTAYLLIQQGYKVNLYAELTPF